MVFLHPALTHEGNTHMYTHTHTYTCTHTHTHTHAHTHTHTHQTHALLVMGWYKEKKKTDQYAEEMKWVFSFDLNPNPILNWKDRFKTESDSDKA